MFVLNTGESTGNIVDSFDNNGVIINTTHYSVEECSHGTHYHENPHICFLFHGGDVEKRGASLYERKTGEIYFYRAGEEHASIARKSVSKNINIEFGKRFLQEYEISETDIGRAVEKSLDAKFLMLKIRREMLAADQLSSLAVETLLLDLVKFPKNVMRDRAPRWVRHLTALLDEKWNEPVTLAELSAAVETHPVTISKYFRRYFSCTLGEYLRKLKIDKSIPLIRNSPMSLTEIAFHCGFADQSHFNRNFKQLTGFRPKEFRGI